MTKALFKKGLIAILIVLIIAFTAVGCNKDENNGDPLADKTALNAEIALGITEQGDYTLDSYNTYTARLADARAAADNASSTQESVDVALQALTEARLALSIRPVLTVDGASKAFNMIPGESLEIALADYVNANGLSKITYKIKRSNAVVDITPAKDGKFTVTAGGIREVTDLTVSILVSYDGVEKLRVDLAIRITDDERPTLVTDEVVREYHVIGTDNGSVILDFADNIKNPDNLELSYSVMHGENEITLDGTRYTYAIGSLDDEVVNEVFTVTVTCVANGKEFTLTYTYKLVIRDIGIYGIVNGGFENGLEGWTVVGNIGNVSSEKSYWVEEWENGGKGYEFLMDGDYMFSAYAPGAYESAVGTLTSSTFTLGGSGFVSFKLGAMKDGNYVYVDVVDAQTKEILARYYNGLWADTTDGLKSGCTLVAYKADLSEHLGKEIFFRISDNADSGYGLFFVDSFVTYYESEPDGFNEATPVGYDISGTIYDVFNGGFELGDVQGWWNNGEPGHVTDADAFFSGVEYGKDGNYLYSGVEDLGAGNGREGNTGVLTSSVFELGGSGYITYMLGGGNGLCAVQVIDAVTGEVIARYRQQQRQDAVLVTYVADLSAYIGRSLRVQVVDNATSDWGCVSFDNLVTYHTEKPEGVEAIDVKYQIVNGSFESGKDGWKQNGDSLGEVITEEINEGWYAKNDGNKDGEHLFSFAFFGADGGVVNVEGARGNLESANFVLRKNSYVAFRFGGAGGVSNRDVYIQLCKADGTVVATFYNDADKSQGATRMNAYSYQYTGEDADCFFRVVDNSTGDYGCFVIDDFRVNLEAAPEGFIEAIQ